MVPSELVEAVDDIELLDPREVNDGPGLAGAELEDMKG
jgi:hypothetical protein